MNNESLRKRLGFDETKSSLASRVISDTVQAGLIKEYDPDAGTKFKTYIPYWG